MVLALVVFGPRRLPKIGRQIGKLMYEFRKASNDFKFQMEEELRDSEEADRRKKEEEERQRALAAAPPPAATRATASQTQESTAAAPDSDTSASAATASPYPNETTYPDLGAEATRSETTALPSAEPTTPPAAEAADPKETTSSESALSRAVEAANSAFSRPPPALSIAAERPGRSPSNENSSPESRTLLRDPSPLKPKDRSRLPTMVDPLEAIDKARKAITERAELPGMSLMEHLEELRKRIVHSAIYLAVGFIVAYVFHERLYGFVQAPLTKLGIKLNYTHPMDPLNLYLQVSLIGGAILASPFILYQVWLFIAPGLYQKEKRFVIPFMTATVGLFLAGASFGYFFVLPGALKILILGFGSKFNPIVTIEEYTGFFLSIILGLGISFELPILIFFLALFGIVSPQLPLEEHSLRHPRRLPGCRHHLPQPRSRHHVHLRHSHARPLSPRHWRRLVGPPRPQKEKGGCGMIFSSSRSKFFPWLVILSDGASRNGEA